MDIKEIKCEKHDDIIMMICLNSNCERNLLCNDCVKEHNETHLKNINFIKGKSFVNEIQKTNSLIEENVNKITKIKDIYNENIKSSLNLLDLRIKLIIDEITKLLNDHKDKIMQQYEMELKGNLQNLNFPKPINTEDIKNLYKNIKDAEKFNQEFIKFNELKPQKIMIESSQINIEEIKECILKNFKIIDNFDTEKISFGIANFTDIIEGYQIVSEDLFSKIQNEFIKFYNQNNYLTILKDFNCINCGLNLTNSIVKLNNDFLVLYDTESGISAKSMKKDNKVYLKQEENFSEKEFLGKFPFEFFYRTNSEGSASLYIKTKKII